MRSRFPRFQFHLLCLITAYTNGTSVSTLTPPRVRTSKDSPYPYTYKRPRARTLKIQRPTATHSLSASSTSLLATFYAPMDEESISPTELYDDIDMDVPDLTTVEDIDREYMTDWGLEPYEDESVSKASTTEDPPFTLSDKTSSEMNNAERLADINAQLDALYAQKKAAAAALAASAVQPAASPAPTPAKLPTFKKKAGTAPRPASTAPASIGKRAHDEIEDLDADVPRAAPVKPTARAATSTSSAVKTTVRPSGGQKVTETNVPARPTVPKAKETVKVKPAPTPKANKTATPKASQPEATLLANRISEKKADKESDKKLAIKKKAAPENVNTVKAPLETRITESKDETNAETLQLEPPKPELPGSAAPHTLEMRTAPLIEWLNKLPDERLYRYGLRRVSGGFFEIHVHSFAICRSIFRDYFGRVLWAIVCSDPKLYQNEVAPFEDDYDFPWERIRTTKFTTINDARAAGVRNRVHSKDVWNSRSWAIEVLLTVDGSDSIIPEHIVIAAEQALRKMVNDPWALSSPHPTWRSPRYVAAIEHVKYNPKKHGPPAASRVAPATSHTTAAIPQNTEIDAFLASGDEAGPSTQPVASSSRNTTK